MSKCNSYIEVLIVFSSSHENQYFVRKRGIDATSSDRGCEKYPSTRNVTSPRYTREPPHFLADFGSFSRFRLQEKHNASLFQYVLQI